MVVLDNNPSGRVLQCAPRPGRAQEVNGADARQDEGQVQCEGEGGHGQKEKESSVCRGLKERGLLVKRRVCVVESDGNGEDAEDADSGFVGGREIQELQEQVG